MKRWDSLIRKYEEVLVGRNLYSSTITGRIRELDKFGLWLKKQRPVPVLEDLREEHFSSYLLKRTHFKSKSTISGIMSHLRCLGDFLVFEKILVRNPMNWMQGPRINHRSLNPKRITKEEITKLFAQASINLNNHEQHVVLVILAVLYGTGCRRGELERLCIGDFLEKEKYLMLDGQKSRQERKIYLPPDVCSLIEGYLPYRKNALIKGNCPDEKRLFVNSNGKPMLSTGISKRVYTLAKKANVSLITLHQFRHTCASDLLASGVTIFQVQDVLGHSAPGTTMRYFHLSAPERKKAMSVHPINEMLRKLKDDHLTRKVI